MVLAGWWMVCQYGVVEDGGCRVCSIVFVHFVCGTGYLSHIQFYVRRTNDEYFFEPLFYRSRRVL